MTVGLEHELQIIRPFRGHERNPATAAHGEITLLLEAQHVGVEAQCLLLIVDEDAVQFDHHVKSPRPSSRRSIAQEKRVYFSKIAIASGPPIHKKQFGGCGTQSGTKNGRRS